jgi:hypothetical protein
MAASTAVRLAVWRAAGTVALMAASRALMKAVLMVVWRVVEMAALSAVPWEIQ